MKRNAFTANLDTALANHDMILVKVRATQCEPECRLFCHMSTCRHRLIAAVQVPEYVETEWMKMINESMNCTDLESDKLGATLGHVHHVQKNGAEGDEYQLELSEAACDGGRVPKKFKMKEKDHTVPQTFVVMNQDKGYSAFPSRPSSHVCFSCSRSACKASARQPLRRAHGDPRNHANLEVRDSPAHALRGARVLQR